MAAALYDPVWSSALASHNDFGRARRRCLWRLAPWLVVGITATAAAAIAALT